MTFNEYQERTSNTAIYPPSLGITYTALGLAGEAGEYCNKIKKIIRDGAPIDREALAMELGDCLWYLARAASEIHVPLWLVAEMNIDKLRKRQAAGTISGSGDNR